MPIACSGPMWFSQISSPVLRIERLQDVHRVHEIHDPVVHERHRLIRAAFLHRPHPRELQILHVGARDLVERAVAPALIVAAHHQPVAGIRIAQHRVGDRRVVLHLAGDRDAPWRSSSAPESATATTAAAVRVVAITTTSAAARCLAATGTTRSLSASASSLSTSACGWGRRLRDVRRAAGCNACYRDCGRWRKGLPARRRTVRLQHERHDGGVIIGAKRGSTRWHRRRHVVEEIARRSRSPRAHEVGARERRRFVSPAEIRKVTGRAVRLIRGAPGRRLRGREHRRRRLLTGDERHAARRRARRRRHFSRGSIATRALIVWSPEASAIPTGCRPAPFHCEAGCTAGCSADPEAAGG